MNKLSGQDIKTLALSALGGALEFFDFIIFVFFTKILSELFFPAEMPQWLSELQVYGIFAAGYLARPVGGIIMAHFGDKVGRKKLFSFSVFLMAVPTLLVGFLPTYASIGIAAPILLLILRIVQGFAIGGEVPAAWVFVAEHVPSNRVGFACASLTSGLIAGILMGSLLGSAIFGNLSQTELASYGWRLPFWIGGILGFFAVWLRKHLHETPVFEEMKKRKELHKDIPLKTVIRDHKKGIGYSMAVTWVLTAAIVVIILMTPNIVQSNFGLSAAVAFKGNNLAALFLFASCLIGGYFSDKFGILKVLITYAILLIITSFLLYSDLCNTNGNNFYPLYILAGIAAGVTGIVPSVMIKLFPPNVRFTGVSFSYNVAYAIFGAITPPTLAYMTSNIGKMAPAYYVITSCIAAIIVGLVLLEKRSIFHKASVEPAILTDK